MIFNNAILDDSHFYVYSVHKPNYNVCIYT